MLRIKQNRKGVLRTTLSLSLFLCMCLFDLEASRSLMGHRRSHTHSRASKRGSPEIVSTQCKDRCDTNKEGSKDCDRSRREKRECKRKRDHEDSSKKKHKEKHKGKNRHHKTKEKPKDKVSRHRTLDNMSSESDSRSLNSRGACRKHRSHSRSWNTDLPWELSPSGNADESNNFRLKRFKGNHEAGVRKIHEAPNDSMKVENDGLHRCVNAQLVQVTDSIEEAELKRCCADIRQDGCDVTPPRNWEQEKRLDGRKDKVLEVELRQRALANFLRHQDVSCRVDEHKERISPTTNLGAMQPASNKEQSERSMTDGDSRWTACLSNLSDAVNADTLVDVCTTSNIFQNCVRDGSELACHSRSNLEEGEISSDNENEAGSENAHCLMEEGRILYDKENTETGHLEHERRPSSAGEGKVDRLSTGVDVAATCINEKRELLQGEAVEASRNADTATAGHDIDASFQQKTMSVMRGGEMVQVNYKVYIPKRAAELARRRLQR